MTDKTFPARGDTSPDAVRARISEYAEWFEVEPVKIKVRKGAIYLTDDLLVWCKTNGASLDWIYSGEPKGMAATYRQKYARTPEQQELLGLLSKLSKSEQQNFVRCLEDYAAGKISIREFEARVTAHRKGEAVPEGLVSIPMVRSAAELEALTARRTADLARDVTPSGSAR